MFDNYETFERMLEMSHYRIPLMVFAFICACLPFGWKYKTPWIFGLFFSLGYSVASAIQVGSLQIPTGLAVLEYVFPPMIRCQFWYRMMVVGHLCALMIISITIKSALQKFKEDKKQRGIVVLLGILFLMISSIELPLTSRTYVTNFKQHLQTAQRIHQNPGAIIEIPTNEVNESYVQQIFHQQPIFWGPGSDTVRPKEHISYQRQRNVISKINKMAYGQVKESISKSELDQLYHDGFRWIVVNSTLIRTTKEHLSWNLQSETIVIPRDGIWLFEIQKP